MKQLFLVCLIIALSACQGSQGAPGDTGATGSKGNTVVGPVGPAGAPGLNGSNGVNGTNGVDTTPMTPVQFCSGVIPSYPNAFPEIGLCFGGDLYAVYSANEGFMVYLPPGTYYSNGINASCTFVVKANCVVQ